jgi:hypothetical protein
MYRSWVVMVQFDGDVRRDKVFDSEEEANEFAGNMRREASRRGRQIKVLVWEL